MAPAAMTAIRVALTQRWDLIRLQDAGGSRQISEGNLEICSEL
jgi:hypothetical protein